MNIREKPVSLRPGDVIYAERVNYRHFGVYQCPGPHGAGGKFAG
jgi:hypothetical protein